VLRDKAIDVDISIRPRAEWARLYQEKQLAWPTLKAPAV
jgi:hypothetical protein